MQIKEKLQEKLIEYNIEYNQTMIDNLAIYVEMIEDYNKKMNLIGPADIDDIITRHIIDSVLPVKFGLFKNAYSIIDVGTGAGLPGLPIAIMCPNVKMTLLDSTNKKIKFLDDVIEKIGINNVDTLWSRAEDAGNDIKCREQYDIALSRAVTEIRVLCEYTIPFIKVKGMSYAWKGIKYKQELNNAKNAFRMLGCKHKDTHDYTISQLDREFHIVTIEKTVKTSEKYPRNSGLPKKSPL